LRQHALSSGDIDYEARVGLIGEHEKGAQRSEHGGKRKHKQKKNHSSLN
jgi:hypothetical protein